VALLGNIIWFLCGGFFAFFIYLIAGVSLCLTVVGIPFGFQAIKLGIASLAPFGKEVVAGPNADSLLRVIFNIVWLVLYGWELALGHLVCALLLAVTIIGLPFAKQHLKLLPLSLWPFGRELREMPAASGSATGSS
jgi:uncharacterized membrane protein YccF (DUF307 family)